ncbi:hypothetical protein BDY19DRAFT_1044274 [Irpex rosettiformis]|uniref:Uncharacterized protein n=1 Tax=Irpex rosettiformis TaxID=378272 RepID=A0ACB8UJE5_9APHY|nr:hypothetical protein BDY19DRAFT_1044274 [Irpex rosettiformis]
MLSRTSLVASRASSRSVAKTLVRANSTTSGSTEAETAPAANTTAPKPSIPRAAAFADLLALNKARFLAKGNSRRPFKAPGVGLASLGDDQFDGGGRVARTVGPRQTGQQRGDREKFSPAKSHQQITTAGVKLQQPRPPRDNRQNQENRDGNRRQPREQRNRSRERRSVEGAQTSDGGQQQPAREVASDESSEQKLEAVAYSSTPLRPRTRPIARRTDSAALAKLFDINLTSSTEIIRRSSQFTLIGTPTILEEQGGDYSRYLEESLAATIARSPTLGPVDYARLTLAKRPDVPLEDRSQAVKIMSTVVAAGNVGAQAAVRA